MIMVDSTWNILLMWGAIGYLLGSIPVGLILAKLMNLGNLREIGSGNIGATNVLRTGNKKAAILTLLFDAGKGALAIYLAGRLSGQGDVIQLTGLMALIGHCLPIWLKGKGGKGVATYLGIIAMMAWQLGLIACGLWLLVAVTSRYSSLAALIVAGWLPVIMLITGYGNVFMFAVLAGLLLYVRHWGNISRLRKGEEVKIRLKSAQ